MRSAWRRRPAGRSSRASCSTVSGPSAAGAGSAWWRWGRGFRSAMRPRSMPALIHGLDFDDTHPGAVVHCTAVSLPAALALGEERDAPGAEILTAYVAAMELRRADRPCRRLRLPPARLPRHRDCRPFCLGAGGGAAHGPRCGGARLGAGRVRLHGGGQAASSGRTAPGTSGSTPAGRRRPASPRQDSRARASRAASDPMTDASASSGC